MQKYLLIIFLGAISLNSCVNNRKNASSQNWYETAKAVILKESGLHTDSTAITFNHDSTIIENNFFSSGHKFLIKGYKKSRLCFEIRYNHDGNFELRREFCPDSILAFEGIVYQSYFYGPTVWYYCNGKVDHGGNKYHDRKIGVWKSYNEKGELIKEIDYKNTEVLDSLPEISKR